MGTTESFFNLPMNFIELLNELHPGVSVIINEKGHLIMDLNVFNPLTNFVPTELLQQLPTTRM
ncbi:MAG: hypothetical protein EBQ96_01605 [Proteobacteria bacterium]|nr:hypothetical protein [Pseudomonadota bacterium]